VESILTWHLVPTLAAKRLDAITNEQVQRLKLALVERPPKSVNNVLTVLSTMLKTGRSLVERATGIEPVSEAWEASVLPLY
jgi:hypothetical protein